MGKFSNFLLRNFYYFCGRKHLGLLPCSKEEEVDGFPKATENG
jgi:hypothetical protein